VVIRTKVGIFVKIFKIYLNFRTRAFSVFYLFLKNTTKKSPPNIFY